VKAPLHLRIRRGVGRDAKAMPSAESWVVNQWGKMEQAESPPHWWVKLSDLLSNQRSPSIEHMIEDSGSEEIILAMLKCHEGTYIIAGSLSHTLAKPALSKGIP